MAKNTKSTSRDTDRRTSRKLKAGIVLILRAAIINSADFTFWPSRILRHHNHCGFVGEIVLQDSKRHAADVVGGSDLRAD